MLTLVAFVFVLGPLILFHELGHFVAAKLTGVRVEEFGIGWPPSIFTLWRSPSRLTVGNTPLVAPRNFKLPGRLEVGQHIEAVADLEKDVYTLREFRVLNPKTDDITPRREEIDREIKLRGKLTRVDLGTAYTLNWIPLGGFCRMTGEEDPSDPHSLAAQPKRERLLVLMGGALMNILIAIVLFSLAFTTNFRETTEWRVRINEVAPESPAEMAGVQVGDFILGADGVSIEGTHELVIHTNSHLGQAIALTLERDGTVLELPVFARAEPPENQGAMGIRIFDASYAYVIRSAESPVEAIGMGVEQFTFSMEQLIELPKLIVRGTVRAQEVIRPTGPVGIAQMASSAIERSDEENSLFTILHFAGVISLALGITNLLPLPALDGGRILFVLIEALRGRRIDPAKEGLVHLIGMAVLVGLMLIVSIQEIVNGVSSPF